VCAQKQALEWMRYTLPGFVYSVGLPPVIAAASLAALQVIVSEPERVTALQTNARYFLDKARQAHLDTGGAEGHAIVPALFPNLKSAMEGSGFLLKHGIYAPPIAQQGVGDGLPRIRFFISAAHTTGDIDRTIRALQSFVATLPAPARQEASVVARG
jgi:7-keto-8-aminopelargonate synthetase-like enzyme